MRQIIKKKNQTGYRLFLLIFFVFLVFGLFFSYRSYQLLNSGNIAQGQVVGNEVEKNVCTGEAEDNSCNTYHAIVQYKTEAGDEYKFTSSLGIPNPHPIGEVRVLYYSDNPEEAEIYDFQSLWLFPILLLSFSIVGFTIIIFTKNKVLNSEQIAMMNLSGKFPNEKN